MQLPAADTEGTVSGSFSVLPVEVQLIILNLLSSRGLARLEASSSYFRSVCVVGDWVCV